MELVMSVKLYGDIFSSTKNNSINLKKRKKKMKEQMGEKPRIKDNECDENSHEMATPKSITIS